MKTLRLIKSFLLLGLFILVIASCKKEELLYEGNLKITFENHPTDLYVLIYTTENLTEPIFYDLRPDSKGILSKDMNIGNYYAECYSDTEFYGNFGFQIQAGETTEIYFDDNNIMHQQK